MYSLSTHLSPLKLIIQDQHGVAVTAELVTILDGLLIAFIDEVVATEGALRHHHSRLRMIEVAYHSIAHTIFIGREDKLISPALEFLEKAVGTDSCLCGTGGAHAYTADTVAIELRFVDKLTGFLADEHLL